MATVTPPVDTNLWSSAGPMPEGLTPSELRLAQRIQMMRDEMRNAHARQESSFGFVNFHSAILLLNSLGIGALLIKVFA